MLTIRKKQDKQPRISNLQGQTAVDAAATPNSKSCEEE